jgi:hypothetical protein
MSLRGRPASFRCSADGVPRHWLPEHGVSQASRSDEPGARCYDRTRSARSSAAVAYR